MGFSRVRRLLTSCAIVATLVAISDNNLWNIAGNTKGKRNRALLKGSSTGNAGDDLSLKDMGKIKPTLTNRQAKRILEKAKQRAPKNEMNSSSNKDERQLQQSHDFSNLRVACFGMSDTWAAIEFTRGVQDENEMNYVHTRFDYEGSYCKRLSATSDNYGFPSQGPNYASTCLQTMIGEKIYDIITVDFPLAKASHVQQLVERLRQRFPSAKILLLDRVLLKKVKIQDPANNRRQQSIEFGGYGSFGARRKRDWGGIKNSMRVYDRTKFRDFVLSKKALKERNAEKYAKMTEEEKAKRRRAPPSEWELQYRNSQMEANEEIHKKYGTKRVAIGDETNLEDSLLEVNDWYMDDGVTLNPAGHEHVANAIGDVIVEQPYKVPIQNDAKVGTFGNGDACHLWFTSGDLTGVTLGGSATLDNYVDVRHAVTVSPAKKGTATIVNPFQDARTLYMSYMVTPDPANVLCNRGRIVIPKSNIDVTLDTTGASDYQRMAHIVTPRTIAVGKLGPGTHTIEIYQLDDGAPLPFRVMGLSFTDETNVPDEYDFPQNFW
eukprot:CAMPEP_0195282254 /NCGR_PEP_ID=MMETSP0707-20130614/1208_1 /TAXON_ID=33640 /ORGANISM="Asterionellopsis glacialis, Strain CCMP134" /LENGTH=547 /DNA_ID=CAMNT_0040341211 /DNA_START=207 /DNA_END=1847 /DNA_ORIENTATION=+